MQFLSCRWLATAKLSVKKLARIASVAEALGCMLTINIVDMLTY